MSDFDTCLRRVFDSLIGRRYLKHDDSCARITNGVSNGWPCNCGLFLLLAKGNTILERDKRRAHPECAPWAPWHRKSRGVR